MTASIKFSGSLRDFAGGKTEIQVPSGASIRETLVGLSIVPEMIALVIVNEQQQSKDYVIQENDLIRLLAVIGGG